jgi:CRP/FNR family cyclic AMP-dependent transcriptional regulator
MTLERALECNHFMSGFDPEELEKLASLAQTRSFEESDLMVTAGEQSRAFYVLLSGSASVEVETAFYSVRIQALAPGDAFGWSSLLDDYDTLFQVRAREQSSALCIDGPSMATLCKEDPELGVKLLRRVLRTVADRIRGLESSLAKFCGFAPAADIKPDKLRSMGT